MSSKKLFQKLSISPRKNHHIDWFNNTRPFPPYARVKFRIERMGIVLLSKRFPKKHFDESIFIIEVATRYERKPMWHTIALRKGGFKLDGSRILKKKLVGKEYNVKMRYFEGWDTK